jgi:hypothetical protein
VVSNHFILFCRQQPKSSDSVAIMAEEVGVEPTRLIRLARFQDEFRRRLSDCSSALSFPFLLE